MADVKMTPEVKAFLTSRVPFSSSTVVEYTPQAFLKESDGNKVLPDEFIPVFKLRSLRRDERDKLRKALTNVDINQDSIKDICRKCVLGWDKLYDAGTTELYPYVEDVAGGCAQDAFGNLPMSIVTDICFYLSKISGLIDIDKLGL
jgi:hypothetical protein